MSECSPDIVETLRLLEEHTLGGYEMVVTGLRRGRFPEECDFEVRLRGSGNGGPSGAVVEEGKFFAGRMPLLVPWCEFTYQPVVEFFDTGDRVDLGELEAETELFAALAELLPPGGRMFVEYGQEKGEVTYRSLEQGVPAPATPIGYLLWKAGFRWFKDWYYSEGWREGGQKLQGTLPLNDDVKRQREEEMYDELRRFLGKNEEPASGRAAEPIRARAEEILAEAGTGGGGAGPSTRST